MVRLLGVLLLYGLSAQAQTITETFGSGANQFSIDFVQIANPGNSPDTTGGPYPVGSVAYTYNIGKYEVSRDMIDKANSAGSLGITLADMASYGESGANRPATGISWNEAARFVNYLNTSKGYQAAYNFTTSGSIDNISLWGVGQYSGTNQYRHKDAHYFLPSLDEWYKGAYGSLNGTWYDFTIGSDSEPIKVSGGTNGAVYGWQAGPADVTNAGGLSAFGTMAQGGNAWEWNESAFDGENSSATENRWLRGGSWDDGVALYLSSTGLNNNDPASNNSFYGFRVAMVPEPSSLSLLLAGGAVLMAGRRKQHIPQGLTP